MTKSNQDIFRIINSGRKRLFCDLKQGICQQTMKCCKSKFSYIRENHQIKISTLYLINSNDSNSLLQR